jgi:hypothetical protein
MISGRTGLCLLPPFWLTEQFVLRDLFSRQAHSIRASLAWNCAGSHSGSLLGQNARDANSPKRFSTYFSFGNSRVGAIRASLEKLRRLGASSKEVTARAPPAES